MHITGRTDIQTKAFSTQSHAPEYTGPNRDGGLV